ncbi:hypothetical protein CKO41_11000 [Thiococcus pfennigii]|nr:hypothetical protein [Thiococcus pfennigii]
MVEGQTPTEWAIAPAGSVLPEGTFLPEAPSAAPGKSDAPPQGAILETRSTEEGVPYMSGGIGVSEREELAQVKSQYNLRLLFAVQGSGEYLSNIQVRVEEVSGRTRLAAVSQGPFFYARLAPGRYNLTVDAAGQVQTRQVTVPANGATEQSFYWASHYTIGDAPR